MRSTLLGAALWLMLGTAASAQDAAPMATIQKFIDSFNAGDTVAAAATHAAAGDLAILDEIPPYLWQGPQAFHAWNADLASDSARRGITDPLVKIAEPAREDIDADRAYLVVPATYTFKERGVAMRETALMTFALRKGAEGWRIHAWTWTGPEAEKVPTPGQS